MRMKDKSLIKNSRKLQMNLLNIIKVEGQN